MTHAEARTILRNKGLTLNYELEDRQYWWFGNGKDVFLDHSATITEIDGEIFISDFTGT
jgi:hypothetical protein